MSEQSTNRQGGAVREHRHPLDGHGHGGARRRRVGTRRRGRTDERLVRPQPRPRRGAPADLCSRRHHRGRPVRQHRQHPHDPALRLDDRRGQHRDDLRHHGRGHRPVRRRDPGALLRLGDDVRHPDDGRGHALAAHGVRRAGRRLRLRARQRSADRLRQGRPVHHDAGDARCRARSRRDHLRAAYADRDRRRLQGLLLRRRARRAVPGHHLRGRRPSSAGSCSTARRSAGARSPWVATPRRHAWPASTSTATP